MAEMGFVIQTALKFRTISVYLSPRKLGIIERYFFNNKIAAQFADRPRHVDSDVMHPPVLDLPAHLFPLLEMRSGLSPLVLPGIAVGQIQMAKRLDSRIGGLGRASRNRLLPVEFESLAYVCPSV